MCSPPALPLLNPISCCCSAMNDSLRTIVSFTVLVFCSPPEYCGCLHSSKELSQHCAQGSFAIQWQSVGRMAVSPCGLFSGSRGSQRSWYGTALSWGFTDLMGCRQESAVPEPAVTDFFKDHVFPPTRQIKFSGTLFPYILNFEQLDYTFMSSRCHNH